MDFGNLTISSDLFKFIQENIISIFTILIENCIFTNISSTSDNNVLFAINGLFENIVVSNSDFTKICSFGTILQVLNIKGTFMLIYSIFEGNFVGDNLIDVENFLNFTAKDNIIKFSNLNVFGNYPKTDNGGSISLTNGIYRTIINLTITDCYSDHSVLGLKIVDNSNRETSGAFIFIVKKLV